MFWVSLYFYVSTSHANINCVEIKTKLSKVVVLVLLKDFMLVNFLILHSVGWCINVPCVIRTVAIWQLVSQKMVVAYDRCLTSKR